MFCWFYKILISHNLDNNKESAFVKKHLAKCKSCEQFYNYLKLTEDKLIHDAQEFKQINLPKPDLAVFTRHESIKLPARTNVTKILTPALAACITIAIVFSAIVNIQKAHDAKKLQQAKAEQTIKYVLSAHKAIAEKIQKQNTKSNLTAMVTDPYKSEINTIKNETTTALKFLVSCVDIHIDNNQKNTVN